MSLRKYAYSLLFVCASSFNAMAAVTEADIAKLKSDLQPYLGQAMEMLIIEAAGDSMKLKADLSKVLAAANKDGIKASISPLEMTLTPLGGGKWKTESNSAFNFSFSIPNQIEMTQSYDKMQFSGVFDEALGYFESLETKGGTQTIVQNITDPDKNVSNTKGTIEGETTNWKAKANPAGGIDVVADLGYGPMKFDFAGIAPGAPPVQFSMEKTSGTITGTGFKTRELLELWKFAVANGLVDKIKDPEALKAMLTTLLPLFGNVGENLQGEKIVVNAAGMVGGAEKMSVVIDLNGFVKDGKLREGFAVEGLYLPEGIVPPAAKDLVPVNASFDFTLAGFDAFAPIKAIIEQLDFNNKDKPLPDGFEASLLPLLLPTGKVDFSLQNTSLSNLTYSFTVDGKTQTDFTNIPTVKAKFTGKGLDEVMAILMALPPEMGAQGAGGAITLIKGLGKMGADNIMTWDIETTQEGKILVNGNDVSAMFGIPAAPPPAP